MTLVACVCDRLWDHAAQSNRGHSGDVQVRSLWRGFGYRGAAAPHQPKVWQLAATGNV